MIHKDVLESTCSSFQKERLEDFWAKAEIFKGFKHKVLIYTDNHSVCPLVGIGTPPTPLPLASVPPPN